MSAWLVSKKHIDVMVTAVLGLQVEVEPGASGFKLTADEIGDLLEQANVASLRELYNGRTDGYWDLPAKGSYRFRLAARDNLYDLYKQVQCFDYQSCRSSHECSKNFACQLMRKLEHKIQEQLGEDGKSITSSSLYEVAPYGIHEWEDE